MYLAFRISVSVALVPQLDPEVNVFSVILGPVDNVLFAETMASQEEKVNLLIKRLLLKVPVLSVHCCLPECDRKSATKPNTRSSKSSQSHA